MAGASSSEGRLQFLLDMYNELDVPQLEMVEVPKVLGDVLESIVGAVFLDSEGDLETVWRIYERLFPNYKEVVKNPPKNMKARLHEKFPEKVQFGKAVSDHTR